MRFMVIGDWDPSDPTVARLLGQEQQRTRELTEEGFMERLLLRADGAGGFMIVSADSAADAHDRLSTLPFVKAAIMRFELMELRA